jgi:MFS family permease
VLIMGCIVVESGAIATAKLGGDMPGPDESASIWRDGAFVRVWAASSISYVGTYITRTALPLTAIIVLRAGPLEISALRILEFVALLLVGLAAGAWVDRLRRRPVMVVTDLCRALLLGSIPVAWIANVLSLPQLLIVAFLVAALSTFFDYASVAYLPTVVARARLVAANSTLTASASAAQVAGLSLSGFLVQLLSGPVAIGVDAVSFLASALLLGSIRRTEPARPAYADRDPVLHEIREGIRVVVRSPILRTLAAAHAVMFVFWGIFFSIYLLFATRVVGLSPAAIGVVAAFGGIGMFAGASVAGRLARRFGIGRAMVLGLAGLTFGSVLLPLAPANAVVLGTAFLIGEQLIADSFVSVFDVLNRSLTQSIVEPRILGRVNATIDFLTTIVALIASIVGGIVGELFGLRAAMAVAVLGGIGAVLIVWFSPVRSMRAIPDPEIALPDGYRPAALD